jgi:hypothetical protein
LQPRGDGLGRQNSRAQSRGPDCPTPCRSAVWAPPSRPRDSTRCPCGDHIRCNGLFGSYSPDFFI